MGGRVTLDLSHEGGVSAPQGGTGGVVTLSFDFGGFITKTKNVFVMQFISN